MQEYSKALQAGLPQPSQSRFIVGNEKLTLR